MGAPADQIRTLESSTSSRVSLTIRWRISGSALRRARPDLPFADADVSLCVRAELLDEGRSIGGVWASLESADGTSCRIEHGAGEGQGACHLADDLLHLDVPGMVAATLRIGAETSLVYARTPLLEAIGVAPGTYEPVGCETVSPESSRFRVMDRPRGRRTCR